MREAVPVRDKLLDRRVTADIVQPPVAMLDVTIMCRNDFQFPGKPCLIRNRRDLHVMLIQAPELAGIRYGVPRSGVFDTLSAKLAHRAGFSMAFVSGYSVSATAIGEKVAGSNPVVPTVFRNEPLGENVEGLSRLDLNFAAHPSLLLPVPAGDASVCRYRRAQQPVPDRRSRQTVQSTVSISNAIDIRLI
jgi:hypothetical protein